MQVLHWREALRSVARKAQISALPVADRLLLVPTSNAKTRGVMVSLNSPHLPGLVYNLPEWVCRDPLGWQHMQLVALAAVPPPRPN